MIGHDQASHGGVFLKWAGKLINYRWDYQEMLITSSNGQNTDMEDRFSLSKILTLFLEGISHGQIRKMIALYNIVMTSKYEISIS